MGEESGDTFAQVFGWMGSGLSIIFFIMPCMPIYKLIKGQFTVKNIPGILLTFSFLNCILWAVYGLRKGIEFYQIWVTNSIGGLISLVWIMIWWIFNAKKEIILSIAYNIMIFTAIFLIFSVTYYLIPDGESGTSGLGTFTMIINIIMYGAPAEKIYKAFKEKNRDYIPIFSVGAALVNCICWLIYGIKIKDVNVMVPNGLGIAFSVVQIVCWFIIGKKSDASESEVSEQGKILNDGSMENSMEKA